MADGCAAQVLVALNGSSVELFCAARPACAQHADYIAALAQHRDGAHLAEWVCDSAETTAQRLLELLPAALLADREQRCAVTQRLDPATMACVCTKDDDAFCDPTPRRLSDLEVVLLWSVLALLIVQLAGAVVRFVMARRSITTNKNM